MSVQKVAIVTMVYKSDLMLRKWCAYYSKAFGERNLYVISHGESEGHDNIFKDYPLANHIVVPRVLSEHFAKQKSEIFNGLLLALKAIYSTVVVCDADEFISLIDQDDDYLEEYILDSNDNIIAPIGFNVLGDVGGDPIDWSRPVLSQANHAIFADVFCKPCILKEFKRMTPGQHGIRAGMFKLDKNLALYHLKYADPAGFEHYDDLKNEIESTGIQKVSSLWRGGSDLHRGRLGSQRAGATDFQPESLSEMIPADITVAMRGNVSRVETQEKSRAFTLPENCQNKL